MNYWFILRQVPKVQIIEVTVFGVGAAKGFGIYAEPKVRYAPRIYWMDIQLS